MSKTSAARQLNIFDIPAPAVRKLVRVSDIRIDPPSQPNKASERGADFIKPFRRESWAKILNLLARQPEGRCLSREEIASRTGIKETTMCGRIWELVNLPFEMVGNEERMCIEAVDDACISSAGVAVTGYRLSPAGLALFSAAL